VKPFGKFQLGHAIDRRQTASYGALGVVLVGAGISKIGEHPVAHIARNEPAEAFDRPGNAAVIRADDPAQILRIEPRQQCRRAHQIAEHHGQLPPLGRSGGPCVGRGCRLGTERGYGIKQSTAVADERDANFL
jgi:hypothetical protein